MSTQDKTNKTESQNTSNQTQNQDSKHCKYPERENANMRGAPVLPRQDAVAARFRL